MRYGTGVGDHQQVTPTWRSRIKAEIAHHRRGVGSAVLVTTELDGYRTGPRLWPRPRMVLPPASLTVHLACVAGPWTEGRLALAGTGGGSDQGLPRFSSSVAPQFPPQKANRPVGSCGAAPAGWLAGCNCSSQGGRPFCHEMTRPTTHSTTIPPSALYVECRPRFRFYYYCVFFLAYIRSR